MALTDNSDLFISLPEDVMNIVIRQAMRQAPNLFNYATKEFIDHPKRLCVELPKGAPAPRAAITRESPLPIPGSDVGLDWCFQIKELVVDFHPGTITLPPQLFPPLARQHLALRLSFCLGLGCPEKIDLTKFIPTVAEEPPIDPTKKPDLDDRLGGIAEVPAEVTEVLPSKETLCVCIDAFATGHIERRAEGEVGSDDRFEYLEIVLDGFEIVDIIPATLESIIECLVSLALRLSVLPRLRLLLPELILDVGERLSELGVPAGLQVMMADLKVTFTPTSDRLPNNPAIEEDQLKAFVSVGVES